MAPDWSAAVSDPRTLAILQRVLAKGIERIDPVVTSEGRIVYAEITDIAGDESGRILDSLTAAAVLEKSSESRLLGCPIHENAFDLMPRLRCPACSSMLIKKGTLSQHICGNISPIESYATKCPKCGKPAPESTLKLMGAWYECDACKTKSAAPNVFLYCRRFNHDFPVAQAKLVDQASFKLTDDAALDLRQRLAPILGVLEALQAKGVQAKLYGKMRGTSGVEHSFDIIIEKGGTLIPVDVKFAPEGEVQIVAVLATYAKVLDIHAAQAVLVAMPAASAEARRTASAYNLLLAEGSTAAAVVPTLVSSLGIGMEGTGGIRASPSTTRIA